jgi:hypothetical protein
MKYWKFLIANATGGIVWAGGTTAVIYYVGALAEKWLKGFGWVGLLVAISFGLISTLVVRKRAAKQAAALEPPDSAGSTPDTVSASVAEPVEPATRAAKFDSGD